MKTAPVDAPPPAPNTPPTPKPRSVTLNRPLLITGMILATALSALDATIVATAMPTIVGALGGLPLYSLVISAFLLTATTTVPLYGKLADMYGRKPVFMFGSGLFILGSALCGLAWDMPSLVAFRAVQGLGAGAVLPISLTIIGDLFNVEERARLQGLFGSVWGVSSVIGPLIGGAIVQFFDWRWVFLINLPVGIFASLLIFLYLREPRVHERQKVDVAGAVTLTLGVGLLLWALGSGGRGEGWLAQSVLIAWVGSVILLTIFVLIERRADAPVLSLGLLSRPEIAVACLVGMLSGGVLVGIAAYVPLLVQGAWGGSPVEAGLIVAPLSIGWPLASALSGRSIPRFGYRATATAGLVILVTGALLLLSIGLPVVNENTGLAAGIVLASTFLSGAGFGLHVTAMLIAVQTSVPWKERGIATASVQFFRNMGNAIGAAVLGAILTATLSGILATPQATEQIARMPSETLKAGGDPGLGPANALFDLSARDILPLAVRDTLSQALASSLWWVFGGMALLSIAGLLLVTRFPHVIESAED